MCVFSMVMDHYKPLSDEDCTPPKIQEFREYSDLAKKIDAFLGKPDCADPEKEKLIARVAALEAKLKKIQLERLADVVVGAALLWARHQTAAPYSELDSTLLDAVEAYREALDAK